MLSSGTHLHSAYDTCSIRRSSGESPHCLSLTCEDQEGEGGSCSCSLSLSHTSDDVYSITNWSSPSPPEMTVCGWMQGCEVHKADLIGTNKGWGHRHTHTNRLGENQPIQKPWLCIIIFRLFAVCVRNKDDRCQAFINAPYGVSSKTTTTTTTKHIHTHIKKKEQKPRKSTRL